MDRRKIQFRRVDELVIYGIKCRSGGNLASIQDKRHRLQVLEHIYSIIKSGKVVYKVTINISINKNQIKLIIRRRGIHNSPIDK